jgi:integrase/recombinase XerD
MKEEARVSDTDTFSDDLKNRGLKAHTRSMSVACVREYLERLTALDIDPLTVTPAILEQHHIWLRERPNRRRGGRLAPRTILMHMKALRAYYNFLERSGVITVNPASSVRTPEVARYERSALTCADIGNLHAAAVDPVDRGILAVFYGCGLRRSEGVRLDVKDVDLPGALLNVRSGKGGRPRSVPMSDGVVRDLTALVRMLRPHGQTALFVGRDGSRLGGNGMYRRVKQMGVRAEVRSLVTLHGLRHAVATHLLERGLTFEQTRDFLGHRSISATEIYTHVKPSEPEL